MILGLERNLIDIVDALDLLDGCVRDREPPIVRRRRRGLAVFRSGCYYSCPAGTDSIVDLALIKAGAPPAAVSRLASIVGDPYASGRRPLNLRLGAVVALRAAESMERRGQTWGMCLQAAMRAAPPGPPAQLVDARGTECSILPATSLISAKAIA